SIAADPDQHISRLALLAPAERRQLLTEYNQTREAFDCDSLPHQLFEAEATAKADAVALVYERENLTYGQLNRRANQLAHYLRSMGVGPETPVAVRIELCLEAVIAILGIMKAGGAYVPIDPSLPSERAGFILRDVQAPLLLTRRALGEALSGSSARVILLD